jgi:Concanavalin A-like lectin/glucanases superfamily
MGAGGEPRGVRPIATSTGALMIGGDALSGQYFAGRIDEVRIYSTALSASQSRPI